MPMPRGAAAKFDIYDRLPDGSPNLDMRSVEDIRAERGKIADELSSALKLYAVDIGEGLEREIQDFIEVYNLPVEKMVRLIAQLRVEILQ